MIGAFVIPLVLVGVAIYCFALSERLTRLNKRVDDVEEKQRITDGFLSFMQKEMGK